VDDYTVSDTLSGFEKTYRFSIWLSGVKYSQKVLVGLTVVCSSRGPVLSTAFPALCEISGPRNNSHGWKNVSAA